MPSQHGAHVVIEQAALSQAKDFGGVGIQAGRKVHNGTQRAECVDRVYEIAMRSSRRMRAAAPSASIALCNGGQKLLTISFSRYQ